MYNIDQIRHVHLEISTLCNASCSWCPRTFWGYPYNGGYPELNLTLDSAKKIFTHKFLAQLENIYINGNFGDAVMNPETPDIVDYFLTENSKLKIVISTNGSARDAEFWKRLARPNVSIVFTLDGLADTHHLYRQNTVWKTIIKNAQTVISHGGHAVWKMILFDHNQHQVNDCKNLSRELGFKNFDLIKSERNTAPVFDRHGNLTHCLGDYRGEKDFKILFHKKQTDEILLEDITINKKPEPIKCQVQQQKSLYVSANGDVYPCCFLGFYPETYGAGQYHQAANAQFKNLIKNNNALEHSLAECIKWFSEIEKSWELLSFTEGRLVICNDVCGQKK